MSAEGFTAGPVANSGATVVATTVASTPAADRSALERLLAVEPVLASLRRGDELMDWPARTLLHAGPAFRGAPALPVAHSAAQAALLEGWVETLEEGLAAIAAGDIRLRPAQDHGCVTPLAAVISPSQWLQVVRDANGLGRPCHAPLNGGVQHAPRLGMAAPEALALLRWQNGAFAAGLAPGYGAGIKLLEIADLALEAGDDCHGQTQAGSRELVARLRAAGAAVDGEGEAFLAASPGFFLSTWMAAAGCMLSAAEGVAGSALVTAIGGNGIDFGLCLAGAPQRWTTIAATPPTGRLQEGWPPAACLPAIGDSAVVDALGFGALCMHHSPAQTANLAEFMRMPSAALGEALLGGLHPRLTRRAVRVGLSARRVAESGLALPVALGILDSDGIAGRVGGGIWHAPPELFKTALTTLP